MTRRALSWLLSAVACSVTDPLPSDTDDTEGGSGSTAASGADDDGGSGGPVTAAGDSTSAGGNDDDATSAGDTGTTGGEPAGDPREPGPYPWTMSSHALELDGTSIPLTLYLPDEEGPHPVVVLSHGFQLSPADYASYGEHLASWGFVAVLPAFPGSLLDAPTHVELRGWLVGILDWIEVIGGDPQAPLLGRADPSAIGLAGHSMGGKISFLTASSDARPQAVFGIDPVDAAGGPGQGPSPDFPSVTPELMPLVVVPIAVVGETTNATGGLGGACAPEEDNFEQYFMHAESPALQIEVLGANHMSFLDDPNCGLACLACSAGTDDPAVTRQLTHGYLVAFFGLTLGGEPAWTEWLTGAPMEADVTAGLVTFQTANGF